MAEEKSSRSIKRACYHADGRVEDLGPSTLMEDLERGFEGLEGGKGG